MFKIKVTVKSIKKDCSAGCKVGDVFYYDDGSISVEDASTKLCAYGLSAIHPYLAAFCRQTPQKDWINSLEELQCPDAVNCVTYQLERLS